MNSLLTTLPRLMPVVYEWAEAQEALILQQGVPLTADELADARRARVACPEKIRVLRVEALPQPDNEEVMFVARQVGLFSTRATALTFGYGIVINRDHWTSRRVLAHECVHTGQYERLGGIRPFLTEYLRECIDPGFPFGSLELEAIVFAKDICKGEAPTL